MMPNKHSPNAKHKASHEHISADAMKQASFMLVCVVAVFSVGCAGNMEDVRASTDTLTQVTNNPIEPLSLIDANEWQHIEQDCSGYFDQITHVAVAKNSPELLVASDINGTLLCVDNLETFETSLTSESSDKLWVRYMATLEILAPTGPATKPTPEPNDIANTNDNFHTESNNESNDYTNGKPTPEPN